MKILRSKHCINQLTRSIPHGVSLIEMLLMISLISVIFAVGVTMLAFLMRAELQGTARIQKSFNLQRLSNQFREDVAVARKASISTEDNSEILKLNLDAGSNIVYSAGENRNGRFIIREKTFSDQSISRNEYQITELRLQFNIENLKQRQIASLKIIIPPDESSENDTIIIPFRNFDFEAVVNQKHSFAMRVEQ